MITAAFRTAKDGVGQTPGAGGSEWIVFRVTDVNVPPVDLASDEMKKLKDTLQRGLTDEQVAQYVTKIEVRDRHHDQSGRLRTGDGREQLSMIRKWAPVLRAIMLERRHS